MTGFGRPIVRGAETHRRDRMPNKRMPAAERQRDPWPRWPLIQAAGRGEPAGCRPERPGPKGR